MSHNLKWITSGGGPLVLVPEGLVHLWRGIDNSDYARACGIPDYIGILPIGAGQGLVLGDEPLQTTWLPDKGNGTLVRWICADSETSIVAHALQVPDNLFAASGCEFRSQEKCLRLFDSAVAGGSLSPEQFLAVDLEPGRYKVFTALYRPDVSTAILLHRFYE